MEPDGTASKAQVAPSRIPWPPLLLAGLIGLAYAAESLWHISADLPLPSWLRVVGMALVIISLALIIWSALTLWRAATTVRPDRSVSSLVVSGPFSMSRNPIYLADTLLLFGLSLSLDWLILLPSAALFVALVDRLAIRPEERHLAAKFPSAFEAYRSRVRRWL